jgi:hypothetical protein
MDVIIKSYGLKIVSHQHYKEDARIKCRWVTIGKPKAHMEFVKYLSADPEIEEFSY